MVKKNHLEIVAADTDILAIFLLNQNSFSNKQVVLIHGDGNQNIDLTKLANRMNEDTDTNLARLRKDGVSSTSVFGLIHILIGSDILCSPRGFGPSWILKTCLDFSTYLFHHKWGIQLLWKDNPQSRGSFLRFMLALFKKRYSSKIKRGPEELLRPIECYDNVIQEVQSETWAHTFETRTMLPSKDCLYLRESNVAFQLKIWMQATKSHMVIDNPEDYGWEKVEGEYWIVADSKENTRKQKTIFDTIMRKCSCKSTKCVSGRCSCKKSGTNCTSLCDCLNCENTGGEKESSDPTENLEPTDEHEPLTPESEPEDDASDNEEQTWTEGQT